MPSFTNLGDLIVRDRDMSKIAVVDLGGEESPREFSYLELDAMANGVARALSEARTSPAVTGWRSFPPTVPNFSRPISASCVPASLQCR